MSELRTLPIRVAPQPGESLDSWLESLARRNWVPLQSLTEALGLGRRNNPSQLVARTSSEDLRFIEAQLKLPEGQLDESVTEHGMFLKRLPTFRYCPRCLDGNQGRWQTRWWLPWTFACTIHQTLMLDTCPACQRSPRSRPLGAVHLHSPGQCMLTTTPRRTCKKKLTTIPLLALSKDHPLLAAQRTLDGIPVRDASGTPGIFSVVEEHFNALLTSLSDADLAEMENVAPEHWQKVRMAITAHNTTFHSWRLQSRTEKLITYEFMDREYNKAGKTIAEISQSCQLPTILVAKQAKRVGIRTRAGGKFPVDVDHDWLRNEYCKNFRGIMHIAESIGCDQRTVRALLRKAGVDVRPTCLSGQSDATMNLNESIPRDIRAAVENVQYGWLRLRRFQIHMMFPTSSATAHYLNLMPSALVTQFNRLEEDIGAPLFVRSVRHAPQRPTKRGAALLKDLERSDVQELMQRALGSTIDPTPPAQTLQSAQESVDGERTALTALPAQLVRIPPPMVPVIRHVLSHGLSETYAWQIHNDTGIPFGTIFKQLKLLQRAGWVTSRLETPTERALRRQGGRGRTYYAPTPAARAPHIAAQLAIESPRKVTSARDGFTDTRPGLNHETAGQVS
nr:TniQ family protein [Streptomyces sp. NBC_00998]